jgi:hypothetical protein
MLFGSHSIADLQETMGRDVTQLLKTADGEGRMPAPRTDSVVTTPTPAERRRSRREAHVAQAIVSSPTGGSRVEVVSMDLSKHGVRLSVNKPLATGTYQRLELGGSGQRVVREVRILSCRLQEDGSFQLHAEFC